MACRVLFPSICVIKTQPNEVFDVEYEDIKRKIVNNFSFYMKKEFYVNGRWYEGILPEIIKNFTVNIKTPLYIEFKTVIDQSKDASYKLSFINIDKEIKEKLYLDEKEQPVLKTSIAMIDDKYLYNNLMVSYSQIKKILLSNEPSINLLESRISMWQYCSFGYYDTYINGVELHEHLKSTCSLELRNGVKLDFNHIDLKLEYC